ncbi:hypothetical protein MMC22_004130 [Lobaria immixta]|nr:hypothetical protein [Lobaria immixta]
MSETIAITLDSAFKEDFGDSYEATFTEWMNRHRTYTIEVDHGDNKTQETMVFDEAHVMNGLHLSTSKLDGNKTAHATVRLSNPALRAANSWYTLYWHPKGDSKVLPYPESEEHRAAKIAKKSASKARRKVRDQAKKDDDRTGPHGNASGLHILRMAQGGGFHGLLRKLHAEYAGCTGIEENRKSAICRTHIRALGARLGLKKNMKDPDMQTAIERIYSQRTDLWKLKTDPETYNMWRKAQRPPRPIDSLGTLLYFHEDRPEFTPNMTQLLEYFDKVDFDRWARTGSVVFEKMFNWWKDYKVDGYPETSILQVARTEFEMINHHVRLSNKIPTDGWLHCMMHSLVQQLVNQDPLHYCLTVALRKDHHWKLVAYPHCTRYIKSGDNTEIARANLNLRMRLCTILTRA